MKLKELKALSKEQLIRLYRKDIRQYEESKERDEERIRSLKIKKEEILEVKNDLANDNRIYEKEVKRFRSFVKKLYARRDLISSLREAETMGFNIHRLAANRHDSNEAREQHGRYLHNRAVERINKDKELSKIPISEESLFRLDMTLSDVIKDLGRCEIGDREVRSEDSIRKYRNGFQ